MPDTGLSMHVMYHCHKVTFLALAALAAVSWSVLLEFADGEMLLRVPPGAEERSADQPTLGSKERAKLEVGSFAS